MSTAPPMSGSTPSTPPGYEVQQRSESPPNHILHGEDTTFDAAIYRLPTEILLLIFTKLVASQTPTIATLNELATVCSLWRDVIRASPLLHTKFAISKPSLTIPHLQRSGQLPIDVLIDPKGDNDIGDVGESVKTLIPHAHRVRSLAVSWCIPGLDHDALHPLIGVDFDGLTELSVSRILFNRRAQRPSFPVMFPGPYAYMARRVTTMRLQDVAVLHMDSPPLQDNWIYPLKHLELKFSYSLAPDTATLIELLNYFTQLETFILRSDRAVSRHALDESFEPRPHPHLKEIITEGVNIDAVTHILQNIIPNAHTPPSIMFNFSFPIDDLHFDDMLHFYPHMEVGPPELAHPNGLRRLDIRGSDDSGLTLLGSYSSEDTTRSTLQLHFASPTGRFFRLRAALWSWPLADVSMVEVLNISSTCATGIPRSSHNWASLLRPLRSLTRLEVRGKHCQYVDDVLAALHPDLEPPTTLICPSLVRIDLFESSSSSADTFNTLTIHSLVKRRREMGAPNLHVEIHREDDSTPAAELEAVIEGVLELHCE